jgi:hypothetical protein
MVELFMQTCQVFRFGGLLLVSMYVLPSFGMIGLSEPIMIPAIILEIPAV